MSNSSEEEFRGDEESEAEFEADEESSDDVPLSSLTETPKEEDDDDDVDSDVPLSSLKAPKIAKKKSGTKKKPSKVTDKRPTKKKKVKSSATGSDSSVNPVYTTATSALHRTECKKGLLIQRLLCRWWYAMDWPQRDMEKVPPPHYDAMDGFPGVFVCTSGDKVGHILDTREPSLCPNFVNLAKKPAAELQTLLLKALDEQKRALVQAEGSGTQTETEINSLVKWAGKLNPNSVDKEAKKVIKAGMV